MSIYAVPLHKWFKPEEDEYEVYDIARMIVGIMRCLACRGKCSWKKAFGDHSLPWGYGDLWCSDKCYNSRKVAKPDKRRERRLKRRSKHDAFHVSINV